jgi:hypothetical protein
VCLGYRLGGQPFYVLVAVHVKGHRTKPPFLRSPMEHLYLRQQNYEIDAIS